MNIEIVTLDGVTIDPTSGAPLVSAKQPITGDDDVEDFGDAPLMQCLGVSSAPYGKTDDGYCEGVIATGVGARDAVCLGARDTRTAKIIGKLSPGDTVVHSTGPNQAAQLQLKEAKKQAVLVTKGSDGKQILLVLDGKNDKVTLAAFGLAFNFDKATKTISLMSANGQNGLVIGDAGVQVIGQLMMNNGGAGLVLFATGTAAQIAAVGTGGPLAGLVPAKGVFAGT